MTALLALAACAPPSVTRTELLAVDRRGWATPGWTGLHYMGTNDGWHYFTDSHASPTGEQDDLYRISEAEFPILNTFPLTRDRSRWFDADGLLGVERHPVTRGTIPR